MDRKEIFDGLCEVLRTIKSNIKPEEISENSKLLTDLGVDSLSMLLMSLAVEQKFNFQFPAQMKPFTTVGEVVDYIEKEVK